METQELKKEIRALLKDRKAVMLAHNYERDEIQEIADICGDSLALSLESTRTAAEVIVFCGVHFMAETAAILNPGKTVIAPRIDAGCPMADMITADELALRKAELPDHEVVTYVNSSAAVKAISDICCTSANAVEIVRRAGPRVLMTPDRNLSMYVKRFVPKESFVIWDGFCPTHERFTVDDLKRTKAKHPEAVLVSHPECMPAIIDLSDHVASTSGIYTYCAQSKAREFIIGTEAGVLYRLRKENPGKKFHTPSRGLVCPNMKLTALQDVYDALSTLDPGTIVSVPEEIRVPARRAVDRMLAVPRAA